jgi:hypothetical protein
VKHRVKSFSLAALISSVSRTWPVVADATAMGNLKLLKSFLGPAYRGLFLQRGKFSDSTIMSPAHPVHFDWHYRGDFPDLAKLYESAKSSQWSASSDIDWTRQVDPFDEEARLIPDQFHPASALPLWNKLTQRERAVHRQGLLSWFLSQFLHGEQGALYAAAQVTQAVPWLDAKLFGSTQVVDEGRHVEVFYTYLHNKLEKLYEIDDNLYVVIDALMQDYRWDVKFLGMQIMVEGLALGALGTIHQITREPLLRDVLKFVISDEARHVHYGVLALERFYCTECSEAERREREDWAFEVSLLLQKRFLGHEIYDEFYGHALSRASWDRLVQASPLMSLFRRTMFKGVVPNLKRIGLLTGRVQHKYATLDLLKYEQGKAAPDLTPEEILRQSA